MVERGNPIWPEHPGQPGRITPILILQVGAVIRAGYRWIGEDREITEQVDSADLGEAPLHLQQRAEVEALDIGPVFKVVGRDRSGDYPGERNRADRALRELRPRIDLGLDVESHSLGISPS